MMPPVLSEQVSQLAVLVIAFFFSFSKITLYCPFAMVQRKNTIFGCCTGLTHIFYYSVE